MGSSYDATVELGVANQVTTFTASDFGRTFTPNAGGTDHGWGHQQLIMGGAVQGGNIYGKMPSLAVNSDDDTGRGRWIPTTSVDEYNATLATGSASARATPPLSSPTSAASRNRILALWAEDRRLTGQTTCSPRLTAKPIFPRALPAWPQPRPAKSR